MTVPRPPAGTAPGAGGELRPAARDAADAGGNHGAVCPAPSAAWKTYTAIRKVRRKSSASACPRRRSAGRASLKALYVSVWWVCQQSLADGPGRPAPPHQSNSTAGFSDRSSGGVVPQAVIPPGRPPQVPRPPNTSPAAVSNSPSPFRQQQPTPAAVGSWPQHRQRAGLPSSRAPAPAAQKAAAAGTLFVRSAAPAAAMRRLTAPTARYSSPVPHRVKASAPPAHRRPPRRAPARLAKIRSSSTAVSTAAGENPITVHPRRHGCLPQQQQNRRLGACPPAPPPTPAADRATAPYRAIQQRQRRHAQRPLSSAPLYEIRQLGQPGGAHAAAIGRKRKRRYSRVLHSAVLAQKDQQRRGGRTQPG